MYKSATQQKHYSSLQPGPIKLLPCIRTNTACRKGSGHPFTIKPYIKCLSIPTIIFNNQYFCTSRRFKSHVLQITAEIASNTYRTWRNKFRSMCNNVIGYVTYNGCSYCQCSFTSSTTAGCVRAEVRVIG